MGKKAILNRFLIHFLKEYVLGRDTDANFVVGRFFNVRFAMETNILRDEFSQNRRHVIVASTTSFLILSVQRPGSTKDLMSVTG